MIAPKNKEEKQNRLKELNRQIIYYEDRNEEFISHHGYNDPDIMKLIEAYEEERDFLKKTELMDEAWEAMQSNKEGYPTRKDLNIPEAASLGWVCQNVCYREDAETQEEKFLNAVFAYSYKAIRKLEAQQDEIDDLKKKVKRYREKLGYEEEII